MTRLELATPTLARLCATNCATSALLSTKNSQIMPQNSQIFATKKKAEDFSSAFLLQLLLSAVLWILAEAVGSLAVNYQVNSSNLLLALDPESDCFLDSKTNC